MKSNLTSPEKVDVASEAAAPRRRGRPRKSEVDVSVNGRRNELIVAAARHFRRKGFDATTTRDIASATGMQSGSPFYHFKTKNELLFAIMEEGMKTSEASQAAAFSAVAADADAREKLLVLVRHHLNVLLLPGSDFIPVMLHEWRSITQAQRKQIDQLKDSYEESWRTVLQTLYEQQRLGTNPSLARLMLFGALHGSLHWYDVKKSVSLAALAEELVSAFVHEPKDGAAHELDNAATSTPVKAASKPSRKRL